MRVDGRSGGGSRVLGMSGISKGMGGKGSEWTGARSTFGLEKRWKREAVRDRFGRNVCCGGGGGGGVWDGIVVVFESRRDIEDCVKDLVRLAAGVIVEVMERVLLPGGGCDALCRLRDGGLPGMMMMR